MSNCHLEIMMGVAWFVCEWDGVTTDTRTPEEIAAANDAATEPEPVPEYCQDLDLADLIITLVTIFAGLAYNLSELYYANIVMFTILLVSTSTFWLQLVDCVISYVQYFLAQSGQKLRDLISTVHAAESTIRETTFEVGAIAITALSIWGLYSRLQ